MSPPLSSNGLKTKTNKKKRTPADRSCRMVHSHKWHWSSNILLSAFNLTPKPTPTLLSSRLFSQYSTEQKTHPATYSISHSHPPSHITDFSDTAVLLLCHRSPLCSPPPPHGTHTNTFTYNTPVTILNTITNAPDHYWSRHVRFVRALCRSSRRCPSCTSDTISAKGLKKIDPSAYPS